MLDIFLKIQELTDPKAEKQILINAIEENFKHMNLKYRTHLFSVILQNTDFVPRVYAEYFVSFKDEHEYKNFQDILQSNIPKCENETGYLFYVHCFSTSFNQMYTFKYGDPLTRGDCKIKLETEDKYKHLEKDYESVSDLEKKLKDEYENTKEGIIVAITEWDACMFNVITQQLECFGKVKYCKR